MKRGKVNNWFRKRKRDSLEGNIGSRVKDAVRDFCRVTSGHGFGRIVDPHEGTCARAVWFVVVACFVVCVLTSVSMVTYESFVVRGLRSELIIAKNDTMDLPSIHVCDTMLLNKTTLSSLGLNDTMASYLVLSLSATLASSTIRMDQQRQQLLKEEFDKLTTNLTITEIFDKATIRCSAILLGCIWRSTRYSSEKCCEQFFGNKVEVTSLGGACISTQIPLTQNFYSQVFGFTVFTKNHFDRIDYDTSIITPSIATKHGIVYAVSSGFSRVDAVIPSYGHYSAPGTWTAVEIALCKTDNTGLLKSSLSPRTCIPQGSGSKDHLDLVPGFNSYSQDNCITAGVQKVIQDNYNCSPFTFHRNSKYKVCHPSVMIHAYNSQVQAAMKEYFLKHCIEDCVVDVYSISVSSTELHMGAEQHDDLHKDEVHDPRIQHSAVHFFYPSFTYQVIKNHPESLIKWLTDVGGNMSLFLGASLVTLIEIVFLFYRCFKPKNNNNNNQTKIREIHISNIKY